MYYRQRAILLQTGRRVAVPAPVVRMPDSHVYALRPYAMGCHPVIITYALFIHSFIHSFIHYMPFNPWIRCVAANILWQPSKLPYHGISSTNLVKALQTAGPP